MLKNQKKHIKHKENTVVLKYTTFTSAKGIDIRTSPPPRTFHLGFRTSRNNLPNHPEITQKFQTTFQQISNITTLAFRKTPKMCWLKPGGIWWDTPPFNHQGHHRSMDSHLTWGFTLDSSMKMVISFCTFGPTHGVNRIYGRNIKSWFGYSCHTLYENLGLIISGSFTGKVGTHLFQKLCLIALVNGDGSSFLPIMANGSPKRSTDKVTNIWVCWLFVIPWWGRPARFISVSRERLTNQRLPTCDSFFAATINFQGRK